MEERKFLKSYSNSDNEYTSANEAHTSDNEHTDMNFHRKESLELDPEFHN
jgi:hypothetical protein